MSDKIERLPHLRVWQKDQHWWGQLLFADSSMSEEFDCKFLGLIALSVAQKRKIISVEDVAFILGQIAGAPLPALDPLSRYDYHDDLGRVLREIIKTMIQNGVEAEIGEGVIVIAVSISLPGQQLAKARFN